MRPVFKLSHGTFVIFERDNMRLLLVLLVVCSAFSLALPRAAAQDKIELFGGYSFVHASVPASVTILCPVPLPLPSSGGTCPTATSNYHPNLNGWEFSGTYKPGSWIGLTADFDGVYGSIGSSSAHLQTYLFGPTVSFPAPVSPFVHVLVGAAHESVGSGFASPNSITSTSGSAFATALGAGIDIKAFPFLSFRPIQLDYLVTRFNSSTHNQPRVSAGVVFHF